MSGTWPGLLRVWHARIAVYIGPLRSRMSSSLPFRNWYHTTPELEASFPCACFRKQKSPSSAFLWSVPWTCFQARVLYLHLETPLNERVFRARVALMIPMQHTCMTLNLWRQCKCLAMTKQIPWFHRCISTCMERDFFLHRNVHWNTPVEMCTWKASLTLKVL